MKLLQEFCDRFVSHNRWFGLHWYISDNVTGSYKPIGKDDFIVRGSERTGMYGINFLEASKEPEKLIAYGWYHRIHTLAVTKAFKVNWREKHDRQNYLDTLQISLDSDR